MPDYGAIFVGGFFAFLGLGTAGSVISEYLTARAIKSGEVVRGKIVRVALDRREESEEVSEAYRPIVTYQYTVGSRRYETATADRLGSKYKWHSSKDEAQAILDGHQVGAEVQVFYDSRDPRTSSLDLAEIDLGFVLLCVLFGFGLLQIGVLALSGKTITLGVPD